MTDELVLDIITPEKLAFSGSVELVTIPGTEGQFSVLKGHAPFLGAVDIGELYYTKGAEKFFYALNTGFAEVSRNRVTILVETAERSDMIDPERAMKAKQRAEEGLGQISREEMEFHKLQAALAGALNRL
ncbi:MAG: F0F1 ATP synthase subunit epsilon [Smithellaceae bacterium]|nr:F0F1 ATP synthase subunit epsilon [Smithellaceae bacterium]